jgi:HK97 family phage portal protein
MQTMGPVPPLYPALGGSFADIDVSTSAESSLQAIAVHSSVDLIASLCSELPVDVFRGSGSDRRQLVMPGYLEDPGNDGHGLADWSYRVIESWLLRGNTYGNLSRASKGYLVAVDLFHPDRVHGWVDVDGVVHWSIDGEEIPASRFLHRRVNPVAGNVLGLSAINLHATQIGLSLTSTQFGLQWFRDGAHPGGVLKNSEADLNDTQVRKARERFMAALRGTREPAVLGKGWSWERIQIAPEESQFLETQQFSAAECARIFGPGIAEILGYSSKGGSLTYANVVDRDLHVLKYALNKWLRRLERFLSEFLPRPQYVKINRNALLETNTLQRYQAHASALDKRWKTVNEVRATEDLPPVPWGDEPNSSGAAAAQDANPSDPGAAGVLGTLPAGNQDQEGDQ